MHYAWFVWSLILVGIWLIIYFFLPTKEARREMLIVSLWTSLIGLSEPLFVPEYWNPPSLFDLAARTGFDIESLIYSFGVGGIAMAFYERIFRIKHEPVSPAIQHQPRHRYHLWAIIAAPVIFFMLLATTSLNPIYSAIIALLAGGLATWYCRPDLKKKMIISALIFAAFYFVYFLILAAIYPGYVQQVWNLPVLSGIVLVGIPLEELLFALSFGFMWSSIYEHFSWRKMKHI